MIERSAKATLVLGASTNPDRYSYKAVKALLAKGFPVIAMGIKKGNIDGINIINDRPELSEVDTISLYINPNVQQDWKDYILQLKPRRIIFNPGTENPEFMNFANSKGIDAFEACTLVMLATEQF
jgi:hypothetical protein